jgi:hypothetical protein
MLIQYCRNCRHQLYSDTRLQCPVCYKLSLPCSENLTGVVDRLLNMGIEVASATCDVHYAYDDVKGYVGKTVQIQVELSHEYPAEMFNDPKLPPDWATYTYHTVEGNWIGPAYLAIGHVDSFLRSKDDNDDECEFATNLTIRNLECWLDDRDAKGFYSVWRLAGVL